MELFRFERLQVWQKSRTLVKIVYSVIEDFPNVEKYALCDQIRRAVVSIPSNIAEGMGRMSNKDRARFIEIAYGSLMEAYCQLILAADLNYISREKVDAIKPQFDEVGKMLSGFHKFLLEEQKSQERNS